jgi:hypothetical protein
MIPVTVSGYGQVSYVSSAWIPPGGNEGDMLIIRNGQPTWVSPVEALRLRVELKDGDMMTKESFEKGILVDSRPAVETPVVAVPKSPKHAVMNAWTKILEGFIEIDFADLKVGDSIEWVDHFCEWGYPNTLHPPRTLGGTLKLLEESKFGWGVRVVLDTAPDADPIPMGSEVFRWGTQIVCVRRA